MTQPLVAKALSALEQENFKEARDCIVAFGRTNLLERQHYLIRGLSELALKDWKAAAETFFTAVKQHPSDAQFWFNLGVAQENLRDLKNAMGSYECSLQLQPDQAEALGNLSNIYCQAGRFAEAETSARRALELGAAAYNSLGLALNRQNKFTEAATAYEQALAKDPNDPLVLSNLANMAIDQLDFDKAWTYFAAARAASNDAPLICDHEGMARLLAGDYEKGWQLCETRLKHPGIMRAQPTCPRYEGQPLQGKKLMLVAEQGYGDTIQFCRYGSLLTQQGAQLIWVVQKNLHRLLKANLPGDVISEGAALPAADFYLPLLSVPLAMNLFAPEQAPAAPYLQIKETHKLPPAKQKVGLVWSGSPTHERDFERSIPLAMFESIFKLPLKFYAPFTGAGLEQLTNQPITRLHSFITDFSDTAGLLKQLDVLITVDTAAAHLAGALGVQTYLLLPYSPDWRWGTKSEQTPWYPSLTLLRQPQPGDWQAVIGRLLGLLTNP